MCCSYFTCAISHNIALQPIYCIIWKMSITIVIPFTTHTHTTTEFTNSFGIFVRWPEDPQEKLLVFRLVSEDVAKEEIVQLLAKLLADTNFSTDPVSDIIITTCTPALATGMYMYVTSSGV